MSASTKAWPVQKIKRRASGALAAAVVAMTGAAAQAQINDPQNDLWMNSNGGNWSNLTNWSRGVLPVHSFGMYSAYSVAQFSQGAVTPYTVNLDAPLWDILVQNDQVIVNLNGVNANPTNSFQHYPIEVASTAGQTSSLTLENGSYLMDNPIEFPQTGGTCSLTLESVNLFENDNPPYYGPISFGGTSGSVFNYTQTGGQLEDNLRPITFGNGISTVNVSVSDGTVDTNAGAPLTFNANVTLQNAILSAQEENINFSGTANVSGGSISPQDFLVVGGFMYEIELQPNPTQIPTTGGTNSTFNASNTILNVGAGLVVGTSGATATLTATGCTIQSGASLYPALWVGISGTGILHLSGVTTFETSAAEIGFNGGTGTVTLSGVGTAWDSSGSPGWGGTAGIDLNNGIIELDHGGTVTLSAAQESPGFGPFIGGLMNITSGTLSVLSGARFHAVAMNESAGSTLVIGLDGESSVLNGKIIIDNTAIFAGTLDVTFEYGFTPSPGDQFQLFSFGSDSGRFSSINLPAGTQWDLSQLYTSGIITAVPEPGALAIAICSGAGLLLR